MAAPAARSRCRGVYPWEYQARRRAGHERSRSTPTSVMGTRRPTSQACNSKPTAQNAVTRADQRDRRNGPLAGRRHRRCQCRLSRQPARHSAVAGRRVRPAAAAHAHSRSGALKLAWSFTAKESKVFYKLASSEKAKWVKAGALGEAEHSFLLTPLKAEQYEVQARLRLKLQGDHGDAPAVVERAGPGAHDAPGPRPLSARGRGCAGRPDGRLRSGVRRR
jgi:hypothetical protein